MLTLKQKNMIARAVLRLPIPLLVWTQLEKLSALAKGKGFGMSSIREEVAACSQMLAGDAKIMIDVGSNKGDYTAEVLHCYPIAEYHLFEPSATNVFILRQRFANLSHVKIHQFGLSDRAGVALLYSDSPGSGCASLSPPGFSDGRVAPIPMTENIQTRRFDEFWRSRSIKEQIPIDYVKIDVEGHELAVMKGFGDLIRQVRILQFEFGQKHIDTRTFFRDIWCYLIENQFSIYRLTPYGPERLLNYMERDETFLVTNFIALNTNLQTLIRDK